MRSYHKFLLASSLFFTAACTKARYGTDAAYGSLGFFNASNTLDGFLSSGGPSGNMVELPLHPDGQASLPLMGQGKVYFSMTAGFRQDFPAINWRNSFPWIEFAQYTPGSYTGSLLLNTSDPAAGLLNFNVAVEQGNRTTCLFSDSLGLYHMTAVKHVPANGSSVHLRLVQLCPDADSVNLRIGGNLIAGVQNLSYGKVSPYADIPLVSDSTLKIRLFNGSDTSVVIARADLAASPGQSWFLICWKYRLPHQYTDSKGNKVNIVPGAILDVRKLE